MSGSWSKERQYWAGEWPRLWRVGKWLLILFLPLVALYAVPVIGQIVNWLLVAVVLVIVVRRVRAARDLDAVLHRRWQEAMAKRILAVWPTLVVTLKLGVRDFEGCNVFVPIARPTWSGWTCNIGVAPPLEVCRRGHRRVTCLQKHVSLARRTVRKTARLRGLLPAVARA